MSVFFLRATDRPVVRPDFRSHSHPPGSLHDDDGRPQRPDQDRTEARQAPQSRHHQISGQQN